MTPVVEAHANDLFETCHHWPIGDARFVDNCPFGEIPLKSSQRIQARTIFILQQVIHGGGSVQVQQRGGLGHIQNPFFSLDPKPEFAIASHGQQG